MISFFSDFMPSCVALEESVKTVLGYSATDLGINVRGLTLTSNFCPIEPTVHSVTIYVQHPNDVEPSVSA